MSSTQPGLAGLATRLRDEFDRSFAEPSRPAPPPAIDLLDITAGTERYALRLTDIGGLFVDQPITRLPDRAPALLGIAAPRDETLPVYDLAMLLDGKPAAAPRWLAVVSTKAVAATKTAALAFSTLHGVCRVPRDALVPHHGPHASRDHVRELAHTADGTRPVVDVAALLAAIARLSAAQSGKERG
ncbi:MAG: chemotaxis protein CheW [Stellaceae bacterium]